MATGDELNSTDSVLTTESPQQSQPTANGSDGQVQQGTDPSGLPNQEVTVQSTGEPISAAQASQSDMMGVYVLAGIGLAIVVVIVVLVMRMKDFRGTDNSSKLAAGVAAGHASSTAKPVAKKTAAKKKVTAKKAATKTTVKKSAKKKSKSRR